MSIMQAERGPRAGIGREKRNFLVTDAPLREDVGFGFGAVVRTLHSFIKDAPQDAPLSICVSGGWGMGKTTLLRGLEAALVESDSVERHASEPHFLTIWFDPWKLDNEREIRDALARSVLDVIERDTDFLTRASISIDKKNVLRMLGERLVQVKPGSISSFYRAEERTEGTFIEVEDIFRRVADLYLGDPEQPRRLVFFVDDLDRCRPARATEVLEAVKLFFDLPGLIFVFALDRDQLERLVAVEYQFTSSEAKVYLEKMFQLSVPLPRKDVRELREFLESRLSQIGVHLEDAGLAAAIVNRFGRNLRDLKLFINSFSFQRSLIGNPHGIEDEPLFKGLYLEATMSRSLTASARQGLTGLVASLEFIAHGGFLHDQHMQQRYIAGLKGERVSFVALIIYAIVSQQDEAKMSIARLRSAERDIVEALVADGSIIPTLEVLREGKTLLLNSSLGVADSIVSSIDQNLSGAPVEESADVAEWAEQNLSAGGPLTRYEWREAGVRMRDCGDLTNAFLCFLMAHLIDPKEATYLCDLSGIFRRNRQIHAAQELLVRAYGLDPHLPQLLTEAGYLYEIEYGKWQLGCLLYREAIARGGVTSGAPARLAFTLRREGNHEAAYFACLDACIKTDGSRESRNRLREYARTAGRGDLGNQRLLSDMEEELNEARAEGLYGAELSEQDKATVEACLATHPPENAASAELSSPLL